MKRIFLYLLPLIVLLSSCSNDDEVVYRVDSTLNTYLQRFLTEASKRGITFNLEKTGLRLEFGSLDGNVAGTTYFENPIRIVIDKSYWTEVAKSQNVDELYEDLVFHELGHGLLNRQHTNEYLSNGDWKSIMCGGDMRDNRSWNINYRSIRREYYINELFNSNTPEPSWASATTASLQNSDTLVYTNDFNMLAPGWFLGNNEGYTASLINGNYVFTNTGSSSTLVPRRFPTNTSGDFYVETRIKCSSTTEQFGLIFGTIDSPICVNYFTTNNNQRMFMGNTDSYGWYTELIKSQIVNNNFNKIAIRKIGSKLYYFINDVCVYYDELTNTKNGFDFGFDVPAKSTLTVDYFLFYIPKGDLKSTSSFKSAQTLYPVTTPTKHALWSNK